MRTTRKTDRSGQWAAACAVASAVVCASVSVAVLIALLWTSPSLYAPTSTPELEVHKTAAANFAR